MTDFAPEGLAPAPPRIVAFTKDWDDVPTCTTHILREMAKAFPVLWIESIGTRKPSLAAGKDLRRIGRRLTRALVGAVLKENRLRVLSPLAIPKTESAWGQWLNRGLIRWQIQRELRKMGAGPVEYWCFVPNAVDLLPAARAEEVGGGRWEMSAPPLARDRNDHAIRNVEHRTSNAERRTKIETPTAKSEVRSSVFDVRLPGPAKPPVPGLRSPVPPTFHLPPLTSPRPLVIYYCVDDWSQFHNLDGTWLAVKEVAMLERADVVFTPARYLEKKCRRIAGEKVHYMPHGVEFAAFSRALDPAASIPADMASVPKPVIGFYGNLHPWVDFELIGHIAALRPQWSFVLIGEIFCDVSPLRSLPNIRLLGRREHAALPEYCNGFDAAIIPYDMKQARMESVNPVKTKELLAAGVPVVAADVPELRGYGDDVMICRTDEEWVAALEKQLVRTDRADISRRMVAEDWCEKVNVMRRIMDLERPLSTGSEAKDSPQMNRKDTDGVGAGDNRDT